MCDEHFKPYCLEVHHVVPQAKGGTEDGRWAGTQRRAIKPTSYAPPQLERPIVERKLIGSITPAGIAHLLQLRIPLPDAEA